MSGEEDIRVIKSNNGEETFVFEPYNPLNKRITDKEVCNILRKYGVNVPIYNMELYKRAFIHRSYTKRPDLENKENNIVIAPKPENCLELFTKSNERLEFIGDGVLECITKYYLYRRFPKENEGFMTEKKIALVKNESIGRMAYEMGLHEWVIMSKHAESKQIRTNMKKLGCLFEAFIGALFLDFNRMSIKDEDGWFDNLFITGPGMQMVQVFVETVFERHVDWIRLIRDDDNYKNILQVKIQKEFKVTPEYMEIDPHDIDKGYHMGVYLCIGKPTTDLQHSNSVPLEKYNTYHEIHEQMSQQDFVFIFMGEGTHKIKKKAEQVACEISIRKLAKFECNTK